MQVDEVANNRKKTALPSDLARSPPPLRQPNIIRSQEEEVKIPNNVGSSRREMLTLQDIE